MFTSEQFIESIRSESKIIKNLVSMIPVDTYSYRPTEGQRTTEELLRYITCGPLVATKNVITGNWDHAPELDAQSKALDLKNFDQAMDDQVAAIQEILNSIDAADLIDGKSSMPWGEPCTKGEHFINMTLKCYVAYRMQLFLYAKASGLSDIGSMECWAGQSPQS